MDITIGMIRHDLNRLMQKTARYCGSIEEVFPGQYSETVNKLMEQFNSVEETFTELEGNGCWAAYMVKDMSKSRRELIERKQYRCWVCHKRDISLRILSVYRICRQEADNPGKKIVLCKTHGKIFSDLMPWQERCTSGEKASNILNEMQDYYLKHQQEN